MKIDRAEVEELLAVLEKVRKPNNGTLAKLCRLALEVMDAPVGQCVGQCGPNYVSPATGAIVLMEHPEQIKGQRVRLVWVGGE